MTNSENHEAGAATLSGPRTATATPDWCGHLAVEINNTYELGLTEKGLRWLVHTIARRADAAGALDRPRSRSTATTRHPESRRGGLHPRSDSVQCPHCRWGFAPSVIKQHIAEKH